MNCDNQVGVKNIMLKFTDCDTGAVWGPISHQLAGDDLPTLRLCKHTNEALPGGFIKRSISNESMEMRIVRDLRIPLSMYQGCSNVDAQIEYYNGLVYSGTKGTGTGDESSDTHEVAMTIVFRDIDELLPVGVLQQAAA